jgi:hypothetical protein
LGLGLIFIALAIGGTLIPELLGLHLSLVHNLIHLISGVLALSLGLAGSNKAYNFCLFFGFTYGLLGIVGFLMGTPGYPAVGHLEADQNLFRIIPNVLELGTTDHLIHLLLSAIFLFTAYVTRREKKSRESIISTRSPVHFYSDISSENNIASSDLRSNADIERKI